MANINVRINEGLKLEVEKVLEELGMNMSTAITVFLKAVVRNNGLPFSLDIPNEKTNKAYQEVENILSGKTVAKKYKDTVKLRKDLKL